MTEGCRGRKEGRKEVSEIVWEGAMVNKTVERPWSAGEIQL